MLKTGVNMLVPLQWQGADALMIPTAPLGSLTDVNNRIETILADLAIKAMTARLRRRMAPLVNDFNHRHTTRRGLQCSLVPLDASLLIRVVADHARQLDMSLAVLFSTSNRPSPP
jgi:hypothetical protein